MGGNIILVLTKLQRNVLDFEAPLHIFPYVRLKTFASYFKLVGDLEMK